MDLIDGMRAFSQVATMGSFTRAAERLGVSKKLVSKYVGQLEQRLGVRLLNRTTRSLSLTEAGSLYYTKCLKLLEDLDELEQTVQLQEAAPRGRLLISASITFGDIYLPSLITEFRERYPDVVVELRLNDRYVDLVEEGFDLAIRIGSLENSSLIARKLATSGISICASPEYLEKKGEPLHPHDLKDHQCVIDTNHRSGANWPFVIDGRATHVSVTGGVLVNSARSARKFALLGGGVAFCPTYIIGRDIKAGRLIPVLESYYESELNIYAVYNDRNIALKTRVFIDFLAEALTSALD